MVYLLMGRVANAGNGFEIAAVLAEMVT